MAFCFSEEDLKGIETPFYLYDMSLLQETLQEIKKHANKYGYHIHYALKANHREKILKTIANYGFGADCVSGGEIIKAIECGFDPSQIVFAGVGKTDKELEQALDHSIFQFNCESKEEITVINELAKKRGKTVEIAVRINPHVNAKTHSYITTGLLENKFGIDEKTLESIITLLAELPHVRLTGIHFHVGSQVLDLEVFKDLSSKVNYFLNKLTTAGFPIEHINVGGGLGINYLEPEKEPIADFKNYFSTFYKNLDTNHNHQIHFELGRSIVGQCGILVTKVLYLKEGSTRKFLIVDGGMTDLIRPALYNATHKIVQLSSKHTNTELYDVVGPVCESSDVFAVDVALPISRRGDLLALCSSGAYGEVMVSNYNLRPAPKAYYSDELGL